MVVEMVHVSVLEVYDLLKKHKSVNHYMTVR